MNGTLLAYSLGLGLAFGVAVMFVTTAILISISVMMNRYIYHTVGMRIAIGFFCGMFAGPILVLLTGMRLFKWVPRTHYFGLLPLYHAPVSESAGVSGWIMPFILYIFNLIRTLFTIKTEDGGLAAYKATIESGMHILTSPQITATIPGIGNVAVCPGAVCEEFMHAAQQIGTIPHMNEWTTEMNTLERNWTQFASLLKKTPLT